jgi:hypothetical protein
MTTPLGDLYRARYGVLPTVVPPTDWQAWLPAMFPASVSTFATRHAEFWRWVWSITPDDSPDPFIAVWPRGGGKSTSAELACAALGLRGTRKYGLYLRDTQERADDSVSNIAALLEQDTVAQSYPRHAERLMGKFGASKGWRRNRLRTAGGFTVDAIGLDTAARGVKIEDQRPDFIVFDDLDGKLDTAATTARKIATLTTSILPAGATNVAILGIQNLIIPDGIFTRLVDGRADFLARRIISGPYPAVVDLETREEVDPASGVRRHTIVGGTASWEGQNLDVCAKNIDEWGLSAFLKEAQHDVQGKREGVALTFNDSHRHPVTEEEVARMVRLGRLFGGIDFGAWRFAFTLWAVDEFGVPVRIDEHFSQRRTLTERAGALHQLCATYGIKRLTIWGDAANPTDIMELNSAWSRAGSGLRVVAVEMENKIRVTSVDRLNRLLGTNAIRFRHLPAEAHTWRLGMNAASEGVEMQGSRLEWEMQHWAYPIPKEGNAQSQDPDDHTADGADMIASMRYAIMSWWKAPNLPKALVDPFDPILMQEQGNPTLGTIRKLQKREELKRRARII